MTTLLTDLNVTGNLNVTGTGPVVTTPVVSRTNRFTQSTSITSTSSTTVVTAPGASLFADLTNITITNTNTTTATIVTLTDGTVPVIYSIPAGGGIQISLSVPRKATTANTAWTLTCGTAVTTIYVVIDYVKVA